MKGLLNVQFAVRNDQIYVLEANPRASRTVPFVRQGDRLPLARLAARVMAGDAAGRASRQPRPKPTLVSVKKPVLPFARFPGEDALLGPEMKSTGEVMGRDVDFGARAGQGAAGLGRGAAARRHRVPVACATTTSGPITSWRRDWSNWGSD